MLRWTKEGRTFLKDNKEMFSFRRVELENTRHNMTPCQADAMGYFILDALNNGDFDKFYNQYMK